MSLRKYVESLEQKYRQEGRQEGLEKGKQEKLKEVILTMKEQGTLTVKEIAQLLKLPVEDVNRILT